MNFFKICVIIIFTKQFKGEFVNEKNKIFFICYVIFCSYFNFYKKCQNIVDFEKVEKIKKRLPSDELIFDVAELFKVFGDSTRMKIISALLEDELCVCDIASIVKTTQSAISHQLRILKQSKLVKYRKEGKVVYYSLDDEHISQIVKKGREHIEEL